MASQERSFKLTIKNVRCFATEQHFDIRPLTFLIGPNSSGKTTVMSCFSTIYSFISHGGFRYPDFNKEPYSMGAFVDIVSRSKTGRKKSIMQNFEIGISHNNDIKYNFCFKEKKAGAEPVIKRAGASVKDVSFCCEESGRKILFTAKDNKSNKKIKENKHFFFNDDISLAWHILDPCIPRKSPSNRNKQDVFYEKLKLLRSWRRTLFAKSIFNMAPVRSKPQRTYNPVKESPSPEGSEIPVLLSNLRGKTGDWKKIHKSLIDFGKASGLFSDIEVRKFGETKGDPFQLRFQIRGVKSNIIDTGYGLSQILPLLARLFASGAQSGLTLKKRGTWLLVQQPEVHLHPAARAELASLFVQSAKADNSFLIETHSDFLLDRTRIEVRKGEIDPDLVSIIYFEPVKDGVKSHNMSVDKQGNLIGAPAGYRSFFTKETNRLLGFEG